MALGFFRKRQKMVIIIMVLLMIAFLIPSSLRSCAGERNRGDVAMGTTSAGEISYNDRQQARFELEVLSRPPLQLERYAYSRHPIARQVGMAFAMLSNERNTPDLAYAMLKHEAEKAGIGVSDGEVDYFLGFLGVKGESYANFISEMRQSASFSEEQTREIVANWLKVYKNYVATLPPLTPSEAELRQFHRNMEEQVKVQAVLFDANDYLNQVPPPTKEEIQAHFNKYRMAQEGVYTTFDSFGFGYMKPREFIVDFLFADADVLERVVKPDDNLIERYYRTNQDQFVRRTALPTTQPDDEPEYRVETLSLAEAWDQVAQAARPQAAEEALEPLAIRIRALLEEYRGMEEKPADIYTWVRNKLTAPAAPLLNRKVTVKLQNEKIGRAVDILAASAKINGICFPWGEHGRLSLDPNVTVSLEGEGMELGEALTRLVAQIPDWPRMEWATCTEFEGILFPVSGVDLFPVQAERLTATAQELADHPVLGSAYASSTGGKPLLVVLGEMARNRARDDKDIVIEEGPEMVVIDVAASRRRNRAVVDGKVFWKLVNVLPPQAPQATTPQLLEQVVKDVKIKQAYEMALADANAVNTPEAFQKSADRKGAEVEKTSLFSRVETQGEEFWAGFPIELPSAALRSHFMSKAFSLVPPPGEPGRRPITVMQIPATKKVAVLRLADFRWASRDRLQNAEYRRMLVELIARRQQQAVTGAWFAFQQVAARVQWKPAMEK